MHSTLTEASEFCLAFITTHTHTHILFPFLGTCRQNNWEFFLVFSWIDFLQPLPRHLTTTRGYSCIETIIFIVRACVWPFGGGGGVCVCVRTFILSSGQDNTYSSPHTTHLYMMHTLPALTKTQNTLVLHIYERPIFIALFFTITLI